MAEKVKDEVKEKAQPKEAEKREGTKEQPTVVETEAKTESKEQTKIEKKKPSKESIHVIPLRRAFDKPRTKMRKTAIAEIRKYIMKHTRKKPKISEEVSALIWKESKPPRKIKVRIIEEEETAIAQLP